MFPLNSISEVSLTKTLLGKESNTDLFRDSLVLWTNNRANVSSQEQKVPSI